MPSFHTRFSDSRLYPELARFLGVLFQRHWLRRTDIHICVFVSVECMKEDASHSPYHGESTLFVTDRNISESV